MQPFPGLLVGAADVDVAGVVDGVGGRARRAGGAFHLQVDDDPHGLADEAAGVVDGFPDTVGGVVDVHVGGVHLGDPRAVPVPAARRRDADDRAVHIGGRTEGVEPVVGVAL